MLKLVKKLENINELVGRLIAWLTLLIVLVTFLVVILRYGFNFGSIALQESTSYFLAFVFMLGAAYTLKHDGHVRVDIYSARFFFCFLFVSSSLLLAGIMFLPLGDYLKNLVKRADLHMFTF